MKQDIIDKISNLINGVLRDCSSPSRSRWKRQRKSCQECPPRPHRQKSRRSLRSFCKVHTTIPLSNCHAYFSLYLISQPSYSYIGWQVQVQDRHLRHAHGAQRDPRESRPHTRRNHQEDGKAHSWNLEQRHLRWDLRQRRQATVYTLFNSLIRF